MDRQKREEGGGGQTTFLSSSHNFSHGSCNADQRREGGGKASLKVLRSIRVQCIFFLLFSGSHLFLNHRFGASIRADKKKSLDMWEADQVARHRVAVVTFCFYLAPLFFCISPFRVQGACSDTLLSLSIL